MATVALASATTQPAAAALVPAGQPEPSAYGGVLLLAQAWQALDGMAALAEGIHWQGRDAALVLFGLVALPVLPLRSVRAIATRCAGADPLWRALGWQGALSQRRLARFAASGRHDWLAVLTGMARALARHPATALAGPVVLALDSTTVEKRYGPRLPHRQPVYDSCQQRLVDGHELVSAYVSDGRRGWPLGLVPHVPLPKAARRRRKARPGELPSKLDQALELVDRARPAGLSPLTVVGDGAYSVQWFLSELEARELDWLVATRADRRLRIGAEIRAFRDWVLELPLERLSAAPGGKTLWGACLPQATLLERHCNQRGLACRPVYVERRDAQGRVEHRWYLLARRRDLALATLWHTWQQRWPVEGLHRDGKQALHLEDYHGRTWAEIVAWVVATSLRASLLAFLQAVEPTCQGLACPALVDSLDHLPCLVQPTAHGLVQIPPPPTLPTSVLWHTTDPPPLPAKYWPIRLAAA